jgi:predicted dehydrogenase/GNAT superfamily N-acetyltransferase
MSDRIIRWGIIGPGKIARKFADDLSLVPHAKLHAVASTSLERARAFADAYGAPHVFGRYEDIVDCPDLDIVYVATPHHLHYVNTLLCLEKGIAVLCEKPFAMNRFEAEHMIQTARAKRVFLMEAMWSNFVPGVQKALELAASGAIGDIRMIQADLGFKNDFDATSRLFDKALGGGSLLDIGIYPVWLALAIFGKPASSHIRATATFSPSGSDETCVFSFDYGQNRLAIGQSTVAATTSLEARIFGEKGIIHLHPRWHHTQQLTLSRYEGREMHHENLYFPYEGWGYAFEAAHVTECLLQGRTESPRVPHQATLDLMETLDHIRTHIGLHYPHDDQHIRIIDWSPEHQQAWKDLNIAWISHDFEVEDIDVETLSFPEKYFIRDGGAVLLAEKAGEIIGTVALQPFGAGHFELAKMTVAASARGLKIGEKLCIAAIQRARQLGARRVFLYSNTKAFQAINLYFKLGFRVVPLDSQDFKRANIQMELML